MTEGTVFVAATLMMAGAFVYALVGVILVRRSVARAEHALAFFALYWLGLATYGLVDGGWAFALASSPLPLTVGLVVLHVKVLAAVAAFFGLVYYLLFIYTGRARVLPILAVAYFGIYFVTVLYYTWRTPIGHATGIWGAHLDYARAGGLFADVVALLLFVPPFVASIAYARLYKVTADPVRRRRVLAVSVSLAVFFGGLAIGWVQGTWYWWGLTEKLLALAAGMAVLVTMREPG